MCMHRLKTIINILHSCQVYKYILTRSRAAYDTKGITKIPDLFQEPFSLREMPICE